MSIELSEKTKKLINDTIVEKFNMTLDEFTELDLDEQQKLIEKYHGKKMAYDDLLWVGDTPYRGFITSDEIEKGLQEMDSIEKSFAEMERKNYPRKTKTIDEFIEYMNQGIEKLKDSHIFDFMHEKEEAMQIPYPTEEQTEKSMEYVQVMREFEDEVLQDKPKEGFSVPKKVFLNDWPVFVVTEATREAAKKNPNITDVRLGSGRFRTDEEEEERRRIIRETPLPGDFIEETEKPKLLKKIKNKFHL